MNDRPDEKERRQLAEAVRQACAEAAVEGYERASWDGLCHEGAWEVAISAIRSLDIDAIIRTSGRES